jgi:enoyl-CoA hydratase/3-hydroxyacyl-CoA dehydrogenase
VEISPGPETTREAVAAVWKIVGELGLTGIRLSAGESSLLERLRGLEDPALDSTELAANLAIGVGAALDQGITGIREIELLLRHGRPGKPSPFDTLNALSTTERHRLLERARVRRGLAYLPASLRRDLRSGTGLAERRVVLLFEGELARIRFLRPQALNALDQEMLAELDTAWQEAEARTETRAIVLEGTGPAFMAGVDLDRILAWIEADRLDAIVEFVRAGHRFLERVDHSDRHTMIRLHGLAVGAGAEFCAAFDTVIATPRGSLGFPETSIGIFPAMGGTQRLPRRVGYPVARWWILGGALLAAPRALELGLVDVVVDESALDEEIRLRARATSRPLRAGRRDYAPDLVPEPGFAGFVEPSLDELIDAPPTANRTLTRFARRLRRRPELALRIADSLIQMSRRAPLAEGLAAEIRQLPDVYGTGEALAGIRAAVLGAGRSRAG